MDRHVESDLETPANISWLAFFTKSRFRLFQSILGAVIGSIFLAIMSQLSLPLPWTPVPVTLQTLGVFLLVIAQGKRAVYSIFAYLAQASLGLPVLAGGNINPFWFIAPSGGYLVGFVLAAYAMALMIKPKIEITRSWANGKVTLLATEAREASLGQFFVALILCQSVIWFFGWIWLSYFFGPTKAYMMAIVPFWVGSGVKVLMALSVAKPISWFKRFLFN